MKVLKILILILFITPVLSFAQDSKMKQALPHIEGGVKSYSELEYDKALSEIDKAVDILGGTPGELVGFIARIIHERDKGPKLADELAALIDKQDVEKSGPVEYVFYKFGFMSRVVKKTGAVNSSIKISQGGFRNGHCAIRYFASLSTSPKHYRHKNKSDGKEVAFDRVPYLQNQDETLDLTSLLKEPSKFIFRYGRDMSSDEDDYGHTVYLHRILKEGGPYFLTKEDADRALEIASELRSFACAQVK